MKSDLTGYRVLVVEDEYFLAADLDHALSAAGAKVIGPLGRLDDALAQVRNDGFDLAVLDINLGGGLAYEVADALAAQSIPFVLATAYSPSEIPERYMGHCFLEKPYQPHSVIRALAGLIADHRQRNATGAMSIVAV